MEPNKQQNNQDSNQTNNDPLATNNQSLPTEPQTVQPLSPSQNTITTSDNNPVQNTSVSETTINPSEDALQQKPVSPVPVTGFSTNPAPIVTSVDSHEIPGFEDNSEKTRKKIKLASIIVAVCLLVVAPLLYFLILPSNSASKYQKEVKISYEKQSAKIEEVFKSFSLPVFAVQNTELPNDEKQLDQTDKLLQEAIAVNDELEKSNNTHILPVASIFGVGKDAQKEQQTLAEYIEQSKQYLSEYKQLVTYLKESIAIDKKFGPEIESAFQATLNSKTAEQYKQSTQKCITLIDTYLSSLRSLKPPKDLKNFNDNLISNFVLLRAGLSDLSSGMLNNNQNQITDGSNKMMQGSDGIKKLAASNMTNKLQTTSSLSQQIKTLKEFEFNY